MSAPTTKKTDNAKPFEPFHSLPSKTIPRSIAEASIRSESVRTNALLPTHAWTARLTTHSALTPAFQNCDLSKMDDEMELREITMMLEPLRQFLAMEDDYPAAEIDESVSPQFSNPQLSDY